MERPIPERAALLAQACANDPELRREVESLLAHEGEADKLLEVPAWRHVAPPSTIAAGSQMGVYRIVSKLGEGGMGEVFRATDTKLHREVALKVVAQEYASDPNWMARFQREARVLASLNHPHIAAVYGLEESGGQCAIAMELVEGVSLAERMAKGRIPIPEALTIARQMAEALEYAHEQGVVHRDLKPANVKLRPDGVAKVLDFGLAKTVVTEGATKETPAETQTRTGVIMGTPAYMAPEQAAGLAVDRRGDIWAFGVVLFEILSGRQLYARKTTLETLAAVARDEPQWNELPLETPAEVRRLLRRCLDRDTKRRLRDMGEARIVLEDDQPEEVAPKRRPWPAWGFAAIAAMGFATVAFLHFREKPLPPPAIMRFDLPAPEGGNFCLSPDGRKLAYTTLEGRLWVHSFESGESRDLDRAGGTCFWSPDSRFIAYPTRGNLKKIPATGGPPQTVAEIRDGWGGGTWNEDGVIVFAQRPLTVTAYSVSALSAGLFRVPASGGIAVQLTALDPARHENQHWGPKFLPDGRHFVYIRQSSDEGKSAIYLGSVDARPEQQSSEPLVASNWAPGFTLSADPSTGYLLFVSEGTLMAQPFDNRRMALKGEASPVAEQMSNGPLAGVGFSASNNDVLVYRHSTAAEQQFTWYDREGKVLGTVGEPGDYGGMALSPDGTEVAVSRKSGKGANIWLLDTDHGAATRLTFGVTSDTYPVWSADGSRIIFTSDRDGAYNLYQKPANGARDEELLFKSSDNKFPESWSHDERFLTYSAINPKTRHDIWVLALEGKEKPVPFLNTEFEEFSARFSPDGHWVAYTSNESGQFEVYVRSFSMSRTGTGLDAGGRWQISSGSAAEPHWRGDGRELYYRSLTDGRVMAVDIATNPSFRHGVPHALGVFTTKELGGVNFLPASDGKRFLKLAFKNGPAPFTVLMNWQAELKK
jgi:serine/threonine protein kinase/Tol biopolymer transport system component